MWQEGLAGGLERQWRLFIEGRKHRLRYYVDKAGYYTALVTTYVSITNINDKILNNEEIILDRKSVV